MPSECRLRRQRIHAVTHFLTLVGLNVYMAGDEK